MERSFWRDHPEVTKVIYSVFVQDRGTKNNASKAHLILWVTSTH